MCRSVRPVRLPERWRHRGTRWGIASHRAAAAGRGVSGGGDYEVNLTAWLAGGYWVRLTDPLELDSKRHTVLAGLKNMNPRHWSEAVASIRDGRPSGDGDEVRAGLLI